MSSGPTVPAPGDPTVPGGDRQRGSPPDVDDLNVTPAVPGPSGTGEATARGGDPDAETVREPAEGEQT